MSPLIISVNKNRKKKKKKPMFLSADITRLMPQEAIIIMTVLWCCQKSMPQKFWPKGNYSAWSHLSYNEFQEGLSFHTFYLYLFQS